jgi:SbsC C-terminal domain
LKPARKVITCLAGAAIFSAMLFSSGAEPAKAATSSAYAEKLVRQSESYAGSLKWAISIEGTGDGKTIPWDYYNGTKTAYAHAKKAVGSLPQSAKKTELLNRLEKNVNLYISVQPGKTGRAVAYIDAINAGAKIEKAKLSLKNQLDKSIINDETERLYHNLSWELKKQSYLLDRVYGQTTRDLIRQHFKKSAEQVRGQALYPVSIKMALDKVKTNIDSRNFPESKRYLDETYALFVNGEKTGNLLPSSAIYQTLMKTYEEYQTLISEWEQKEVTLESAFVRYAGSKGTHLTISKNHTMMLSLTDAYPLESLDLHLSAPAKKAVVYVTREMNGEEMTEEIHSVEKADRLSADLSQSELFKLPDPTLKENDGAPGRTFRFKVDVTNLSGETSSYYANLGIGAFKYGSGFKGGTYYTDYGYSIDVAGAFTLYDHGNGLVYIPRDESCLIDDPIKGTVICEPTGHLSLRTLEQGTDMEALRLEALQSYGTPVKDVEEELLPGTLYHVYTAANDFYLYEMVINHNGRLLQINYSIERNADYVRAGIESMLKSIK